MRSYLAFDIVSFHLLKYVSICCLKKTFLKIRTELHLFIFVLVMFLNRVFFGSKDLTDFYDVIDFLVNKRQYCFSRPLKLEGHVRDWTTGYRPLLHTSFLQKKTPKSRDRFSPKFSKIPSELYSFISASLVVIVTVELAPQNVGQI